MKTKLDILFWSIVVFLLLGALFIPVHTHYTITSVDNRYQHITYYPPLSTFVSSDTVTKIDTMLIGKVTQYETSSAHSYYVSINVDNKKFIYKTKEEYYMILSNMRNDSSILYCKSYWPTERYEIIDKYKK